MANTPTLEWTSLGGKNADEVSNSLATGLDGAISMNFSKSYLNPITGKDFHRL